jgi:ElaB/YqjD/DUF883 family membrane-anchored ribosome-binding protein
MNTNNPGTYTTDDSLGHQAYRDPGMPSAGTSGSGPISGDDPVQRAARGAHETVDRLAEKAAPAVDRLKETYAGVSQSVQSHAEEWMHKEQEMVESTRTYVREHPMASVAAAMAVGMLLGRVFLR